MGQYYTMVNLDKKQILKPHDFDSGSKLMELSSGTENPMRATGSLLTVGNPWFADRLVLTGDYADEGRFVPANQSTLNLSTVANEEYQRLSVEDVSKMSEGNLPQTLAEFCMEKMGKTFDWSNFPYQGKFEKAYDPSAWSSIILDDFDEFLDMVECPITSNVAALEDSLATSLRWSVLFKNGATRYTFSKFTYSTVVKEDAETGNTTVPMQLEATGRNVQSSTKRVELTFPCTLKVVMDAFEPTEILFSSLTPQRPKDMGDIEVPPQALLPG